MFRKVSEKVKFGIQNPEVLAAFVWNALMPVHLKCYDPSLLWTQLQVASSGIVETLNNVSRGGSMLVGLGAAIAESMSVVRFFHSSVDLGPVVAATASALMQLSEEN